MSGIRSPLCKDLQIAAVTAVRGNADKDWAENIPQSAWLEILGNRIFVIHNKGKISEDVDDADIIIYGHSHKYSNVEKDGQIWFNREYTYECAVEEMPAGYGDTLMSVSPAWTFPVVVIIGIIMSVLISNVFMKKQKAIEKSRS